MAGIYMERIENKTDGTSFIVGIFRYEIKNRFRCLVNINGEDIVCYIPSSCRLSKFIDLSNKEVLLQPIKSTTAKLKYSVFAVKYGRSYILLNLSMANRIIETHIGCRCFSFLGNRKNISHEETIDGYKSDLYIRDVNTIIEVKTVLTLENEAIFPSVYSERSFHQLVNIEGLLSKGYKVCYVFVSLSPYVKCIKMNTEMGFASAFLRCVRKGMTYCGVSVCMRNGVFVIHSKIQIDLSEGV